MADEDMTGENKDDENLMDLEDNKTDNIKADVTTKKEEGRFTQSTGYTIPVHQEKPITTNTLIFLILFNTFIPMITEI